MIKIRKINKVNTGIELQLMNLQLECLPEDEPMLPGTDRKCCELRKIGEPCYDCPDLSWWWMGYSNKKPVCFSSMKQSSQWCDTVYLSRSGVLPKWRGRGLQKKMIGIREKLAKKLGYNWIVTDTTDNIPSSNSLISKNYKMFEPSNPWAHKESIYWRKKI